ncbi:hypothetical protein PG995_013679 [Apiospora arundinis]|uniref:Uncharacterized protein n=1 Tax=Apiospora arundinis TaxID=335852 RepID=A0ABR2I1N4_9PEZI
MDNLGLAQMLGVHPSHCQSYRPALEEQQEKQWQQASKASSSMCECIQPGQAAGGKILGEAMDDDLGQGTTFQDPLWDWDPDIPGYKYTEEPLHSGAVKRQGKCQGEPLGL